MFLRFLEAGWLVNSTYLNGLEMPSSNQTYWRPKIAGNKARDALVATAFRKRGWRVLRIWEQELKKPSRCLARVVRSLSLAPPDR